MKPNKQVLKLMVKDREDPMADFKWATRKEIKPFKKLGYKVLTPENN